MSFRPGLQSKINMIFSTESVFPQLQITILIPSLIFFQIMLTFTHLARVWYNRDGIKKSKPEGGEETTETQPGSFRERTALKNGVCGRE